jgi:hypothetical protein
MVAAAKGIRIEAIDVVEGDLDLRGTLAFRKTSRSGSSRSASGSRSTPRMRQRTS